MLVVVAKMRKASDDCAKGRKHQAISMATKVAMTKKSGSGEKMANVARVYGMN